MGRLTRNASCPCGSGRRYKSCCGELSGLDHGGQADHPMYPGWARLAPDVRSALWRDMCDALRMQGVADYDGARRIYERVLSAAPDTFDALHMLGVIELECGDFDRAEALIVAAARWLDTAPLRSNLALLRHRRRESESGGSLRGNLATEAIALVATEEPSLREPPPNLALSAGRMPASWHLVHVVVPGTVTCAGSNHVGQRIFDRLFAAGRDVRLWTVPREGAWRAPLDARACEVCDEHRPRGGVLVVVGLDDEIAERLAPDFAACDELWLMLDTRVPTALLDVIHRLGPRLARLHLAARSCDVLDHLGVGGHVDPFLLGGPPAPSQRRGLARGRMRVGVFILAVGGSADKERHAMLEWLREQDVFMRILYPGRLPSRHVADEREHLVGLDVDWDRDWAHDLDALFYWGGEGRAHQYDGLVVEGRASGLRVIAHGLAETIGSVDGDEVFFSADEARDCVLRVFRTWIGGSA